MFLILSHKPNETLVFNSAIDDTQFATISPNNQACHHASSKQPP